MVAPYAATLGGLTIAINSERFLLEDIASNSVLSLHPAVTLSGEKKAKACDKITGFAMHDDRMEISWDEVGGLALTTILSVIADSEDPPSLRYMLGMSAKNTSHNTVSVDKIHPIYFQSQGPGACALGLEDLRTLGSSRPGGENRLMRLQGDTLYSTHYGTWFSPMGSPLLLLATLDVHAGTLQFQFGGARGKMLSLRADISCDYRELAPGESIELPAMLLVIGDFEINEELNLWIERIGDIRIAGTVPEFLPSDTIVDPAPEEEEEKEDVLEEEPEEEPGDSSGEGQEGESDDFPEVEQEVAIDDVVADSPEEEVADAMEDEEYLDGMETLYFDEISAWRVGRCAAYYQAMRKTRGYRETGKLTTPRWASGRRHQPINGCSVRTRGYWRFEYTAL